MVLKIIFSEYFGNGICSTISNFKTPVSQSKLRYESKISYSNSQQSFSSDPFQVENFMNVTMFKLSNYVNQIKHNKSY